MTDEFVEEILEEAVVEDSALDQIASDEDSVVEEVANPEDESSKEFNFARLRESKAESDRKAELAIQEAKHAREYAERLEKMYQSGQQKPKVQEEVQEESLDFTDAVDSEHLKRMNARLDAQERKAVEIQQKYEDKLADMTLRATDGNYIETINKYLPQIIDEDPDIKDIIRYAPKSKQMKMMLKFAKTNPNYNLDKTSSDVIPIKSKVERNLEKTQTLGALSGQSKSTVKPNDVWSMSPEKFDEYMKKITQG